MALVTGTPEGLILTQDDLYIDVAPNFYFQPIDLGDGQGSSSPLNNPDSDDFYWGLSGTVARPVYQAGCYDSFQWASNIEMNDIRCDTVGNKGTIQKMANLDVTFNLKTLLPLAQLRHMLRWGAVTESGGVEKVGVGQPNNQVYYRVYFPAVYDEANGDYVAITMHRCQFVDSWQMSFTYGQQSMVGITCRGFADDSKPADQLYATVIRADPSALV